MNKAKELRNKTETIINPNKSVRYFQRSIPSTKAFVSNVYITNISQKKIIIIEIMFNCNNIFEFFVKKLFAIIYLNSKLFL